MMKTVDLVAIAVLLLFLGYTRGTYSDNLSSKERVIAESRYPIVGRKAPQFTLPTLAGGSISLADYAGRPLVIAFWTTWCAVCKKEFPLFEQFKQEYGERIAFLSICSGSTPQKASTVIEEGGYTFPVLYDEGKATAGTYQPQKASAKRRIIAFPFTVFVDEQGIVVYAKVGMFPDMNSFLKRLRAVEFPVDEKLFSPSLSRGAKKG